MTTKKAATKGAVRNAPNKSTTPPAGRWSAKVDTVSTHPDHGLFLKSPRTIANALATEEVSPKGPASGMRMLNFYINRAGKNLSKERVAELESAKELLSGIIARQQQKKPALNTVAVKKTAVKKHIAKKFAVKKPAAKKSREKST